VLEESVIQRVLAPPCEPEVIRRDLRRGQALVVRSLDDGKIES